MFATGEIREFRPQAIRVQEIFANFPEILKCKNKMGEIEAKVTTREFLLQQKLC